MATSPEFGIVDYYGGPLDGEAGAMSDGVRLVRDGGFYEAAWLKGNRRLVWHEVHGLTTPGTPSRPDTPRET